jgi:CBS domain-containing protein
MIMKDCSQAFIKDSVSDQRIRYRYLMSFLISYNGQFSPLISPVDPSARNLIHPVTSIKNIASAHEFKEVLEEVQHPPEAHKEPNQKLGAYKQAAKSFEESKKRFYAKDIMSFPVKLIQESAATSSAKELMAKFGFRHLPVINHANIITGLITDRELTAGTENNLCSEIMLKRVIVADEHASINEIAIIFLKEKINALPVVDSKREIVGIITHSDILKYVIETSPFLGKA